MQPVQREIKDSLFVDLFCGDEIEGKRNFLSLYNAINETNIVIPEDKIQRRLIPQVVYKTFRNDIGMQIEDRFVVLIEHQSTINNNMPLRLLEYICRIYTQLLPVRSRYYEKLIKVPKPEFYVFYNGTSEIKETKLKLSNAFYIPYNENDKSFLELEVPVFPLRDPNLLIVKNCSRLREYEEFIELVEQGNRNDPESCNKLIEAAIKKGLLHGYLERKTTEVFNLLTSEYSYEEDIAAKTEEAIATGIETGIEQTALNMLSLNTFTIEQISSATRLPITKIIELKSKISS